MLAFILEHPWFFIGGFLAGIAFGGLLWEPVYNFGYWLGETLDRRRGR